MVGFHPIILDNSGLLRTLKTTLVTIDIHTDKETRTKYGVEY